MLLDAVCEYAQMLFKTGLPVVTISSALGRFEMKEQ
jgi:hypothetical protein